MNSLENMREEQTSNHNVFKSQSFSQARKEGKREWVEHECKCEHGYTGVTCAIKVYNKIHLMVFHD